MLMAAIAFNVKKYLKTFKRKLVSNKVMEAPFQLNQCIFEVFNCF